MKKIFFQILILASLFVATWFLLRQVNWMKLFNIEKLNHKTEEKLGDIFWDLIKQTNKTIENKKVTDPVDSLLTKICDANGIDRKEIKLHVVESDEVNAFALPNNHLVVYTGLIKESDNETQVAGVMAHEVAHLEYNHVMKKLVKEVGLSVLISIAGGNGSGEAIKGLLKTLSSTAYDRKLEKQADLGAVDYMIKADMNPEELANFLYKLVGEDVNKHLILLSTHPATKERAEYIVEACKGRTINEKQVLAKGSFDNLKKNLDEE